MNRSDEDALRGRWNLEGSVPLSGIAPGASWYRARPAAGGDRVVLFVVRGEAAAETADAARRAYLVQHPGLLPVLDVDVIEGEGDEGPMTVVSYPYPSARPMSALLAERPLRPETARSVIGEVTEALEAARRRGVRHQHLDSNRIFADLDLGTVAVLGTGVETASFGPEDPGGGVADEADVHALVALLYRAMTGRPARRGENGEVPAASDVSVRRIPEDLENVCDAVLNHREDAPRSVRQLAEWLGPWQSIPVTLQAYEPDAHEVRHTSRTGRTGPQASGAAAGLAFGSAALAAGAPAAGTAGGDGTVSDPETALSSGDAAQPGADDAASGEAQPAETGSPSGAVAEPGDADTPDAAPAHDAQTPNPEPAPADSSQEMGAEDAVETGPSGAEDPTAVEPAAAETETETASPAEALDLTAPRAASAFPASMSIQLARSATTPSPAPAAEGPAGEAVPSPVSDGAASKGTPTEGSVSAGAVPEGAASKGAVSASEERSAVGAPEGPDSEPVPISVPQAEEPTEGGPIVVPGRTLSVSALPPEEVEANPRQSLLRDVVGVALDDDDPATYQLGPAESTARSRQTQWILLGAALLVILALVFAITSITTGLRDQISNPLGTTSAPAPTASETESPSAAASSSAASTTTSSAPADPPEIEKMSVSGIDHPENADRLHDGSATSIWRSKIYRTANFGGLSKTTEISIDLKEKTTVTALKVSAGPVSGGTMVVRAGDDDADLATGSFTADGTTTLTLDKPVSTDELTLVITELPKDGSRYRAQISEITVE